MSGLFNVLTDSLIKYLQGTFIYNHNLFTLILISIYVLLFYSKV